MSWTFPNNLIDITSAITADSTWRTLNVTSTSVPNGTRAIWLRARMNGSGTSTVAFSSADITSNPPTKAVLQSQANYYLLGLDTDGNFRYNVSAIGNLKLEIFGYSDNDVTFPDSSVTTYVDKTPGSNTNWTDTDCSAQIPVDAAFAVFLAHNVGAGSDYELGLRDNGSARSTMNKIARGSQTAYFSPMTSRVTELYTQDKVYGKFYLTGWLPATSWQKLPSIYEISFASTGWQDVDLSAIVPAGATAVLFEICNNNAAFQVAAYRPKASSENITTGATVYQGCNVHGMMSLDSSRLFSFNPGSTDVKLYVIGYYLEAPVVIKVNAVGFRFDLMPVDTANLPVKGNRKKFNIELEL